MVKVLLLFIFINSNLYSNENIFGNVFYIKGEAIVDRPDGVKNLQKGDILFNQDIVKSKESSILIISFGEGMKSKMKITENTQILLQQKKSKEDNKISLAIGVGNVVVDFFNKDKKQPSSLKLETANVSLGIRGTRFFVINESNGDFAASVKNGTVNVASKAIEDNVVVLEQGKGTMLNEKKEIIQSQSFDWHEDVNWKTDPQNGELSHSQKFFNRVKKSFENYRNHIAAKMKNRRKNIKNKMQKMRQQRLEKRKLLLKKR